MNINITTSTLQGYTTIMVTLDTPYISHVHQKTMEDIIQENLDALGTTARHKAIISPLHVINHHDWDETWGIKAVVLSTQGSGTIICYLNGMEEDLAAMV